jgi:uncharacterized protein (TIGR03067 family)
VAAIAILSVLLASCSSERGGGEQPPAPAGGKLEGDYARIQGTWTVVYNELKGVPTPPLYGALHIYRADRFRLGDDPPGDGELFILDETSNPKRIDFDDGHTPRILGIYKLEDNRLTVCTGGPGEARPTEFKTSPVSGTILTRLERR